MINDLVNSFINFITGIYSTLMGTTISDLITHLNTYQTYTSDFAYYLSGVYFIIGKPLCIFLVVTFSIIVTIRLVMALINIVGQFVP